MLTLDPPVFSFGPLTPKHTLPDDHVRPPDCIFDVRERQLRQHFLCHPQRDHSASGRVSATEEITSDQGDVAGHRRCLVGRMIENKFTDMKTPGMERSGFRINEGRIQAVHTVECHCEGAFAHCTKSAALLNTPHLFGHGLRKLH